MNWRCFFGRHDLRFVKSLTDLSLLHHCRRCEERFVSTIAAGPEMVFALNSRLGRDYTHFLARRGVKL